MASQIAAIPAPEGYVVNFDDPARYGELAGNFAVEDACLIVAWLCGVTVQAILVSMWLEKIVGVHAWEISIEKYNMYSKLIMSASVIYVPCLGLSKFSLLLFYNRLSPVRWFRIAVYFLMFVVLGYSFAIIFALIFPCHPVAMNWDVTITDGKCVNRAATYTATAAMNIATDLALLTLPIPMIADLRMPRVQKVGLIIIFVVGSFTVEANLVIICGSFPLIRQFFKHIAPRWIGENSSSKVNSSAHPYDLETIGQKSSKKNRPSRRAYGIESLDDIDNDLELDGRFTEHKVEIAAGNRADSGCRGRVSDSDGERGDAGSETHIVQTNVTNVSFSRRE
ncbi:hypothetical protein EYC80_005470 [Monilinia laxa]|uniref:Rhodopsin domain-containing protein n=1 Tax=Monilinia laxa TaxID=61186 RepID=A0A5N6KEA1_MONLA|nr:hypothetical protein EYC80_005470 [Monilinia laxa]